VRVLLSAVGLVAVAILWGEVVHWRASRRLTSPGGAGTEAIVVLGYRNPSSEQANVLNRWRVRAGLRSIDPRAPSTRLVFSGGPYEAAVMARYATEQCGFTGEVVVEDASRTTWENIENVIPFIDDADRIKIVSNPLHAQKARLYLQRQRPDLATRMVRSADYRFGEWALLKPLFAAYGLVDMAKTKRNLTASA
jgi:uncharacterized SAM-binding protein YcdF (DUF218 family)